MFFLGDDRAKSSENTPNCCDVGQVYYTAIVVDLVLRFNWLYSLIPPGHNPLPFLHSSTLPVFVTTVVIVCEFVRRTMWGFFRVENEHLNNTEVMGCDGMSAWARTKTEALESM